MDDGNKATAAVKRSYDRFAHLYDFIERRSIRFRFWREMLWAKVEGRRILEIGVGTGGNFSYYPPGTEVTGIDVSDKMLARAKERAEDKAVAGRLLLMDAQNLGFKDNSFDTVVASLVFCSVPDPVRGLKEIERVVKRNGKVVLLEHVLSSNLYLALMMQAVNPFTRKLFGENFNRKTVENVARSGLVVEKVTDLGGGGIFKLIEARKRAIF
ncbi:MAG: methyltransferase domain-containing protein [Dehalococcoidales bacterium]|nr:methyltransferase domain-containing protein [Dehalococcoidales bacterium]